MKLKYIIITICVLISTHNAHSAYNQQEIVLDPNAFFKAAKEGNITLLEQYINNNFDINTQEENTYRTALMYAAEYGQEQTVRFLLGCPEINPNIFYFIEDTYYNSALTLAALNNHRSIVLLLMNAKLKLTSFDLVGLLKYLIKEKKQEMVQFIINHGHKYINRLDDLYQATALMWLANWASDDYSLEIAHYLLNSPNIDVNTRIEIDNSTALMIAASHGKWDEPEPHVNHSEIVKLLLKSGKVDLNARDNSGNTALHQAVLAGNTKAVEYLLCAHGLLTESKNTKGLTALDLAYKKKLPDIIKLLEKRKTTKQMPDAQQIALRYAIDTHNKSLLKKLMQSTTLDIKDSEGNNPLHWAISKYNQEIINLLITFGGYLADKPNNKGETPFMLAPNKPEVLKYLLLPKVKVRQLSSHSSVIQNLIAAGAQAQAQEQPPLKKQKIEKKTN